MIIDQIVPIVIAIFASTGFWQLINTLVASRTQKEDLQKRALQALLRDRMLDLYRHYKDYGLDSTDKSNFENLYNCYHNLGQNGVMTSIYNEVLTMKTND